MDDEDGQAGPGKTAHPGTERVGGWRISPGSAEQYQRRIDHIWRAAAEFHGIVFDPEMPRQITPMEVIDYLLSRRPDDGTGSTNGTRPLAENSWNAYRSALIWFLEARLNQKSCAEALDLLKVLRYRTDVDPAQLRLERRKILSSKGIPIRHFTDLVRTLRERDVKAQWGDRAATWLLAGVSTGLRPGEWEFAEWDGPGQEMVLVKTLKAKADITPLIRQRILQGGLPRPEVNTDPSRLVPVMQADRADVDKHMTTIAKVVAQGTPFKLYYEKCRQTLWKTCHEMWPDGTKYSLNDARHQFAANLRAWLRSDAGKAATAAGGQAPDALELSALLMGHSNNQTARRSYAPRKNGWGGGGAGRQTQVEQQLDRSETSENSRMRPRTGS